MMSAVLQAVGAIGSHDGAMTEDHVLNGMPDSARYDRAAKDFIDATIALSDIHSKVSWRSPLLAGRRALASQSLDTDPCLSVLR
jgi:hypothetical protein